jgi:hypothetical protein
MKLLSDRERRWNEQAATIAASVLSEPVEAATRCERVTEDQKMEAVGMGRFSRFVAKFDRTPSWAMGNLGGMEKQMKTGGLPGSFILAVTRSQVHALEDKHAGEELVAGNVLKSWDRAGFKARTVTDAWNMSEGVPDDRQLLIIFVPIEAGNNPYLQAGARIGEAAGQPGFPTNFMVAKDAPSQRVIDALDAAGHVRVIGGESAAPAAPAAAPAQRLQELETLRATGAISDAEYTSKREQIIADI